MKTQKCDCHMNAQWDREETTEFAQFVVDSNYNSLTTVERYRVLKRAGYLQPQRVATVRCPICHRYVCRCAAGPMPEEKK